MTRRTPCFNSCLFPNGKAAKQIVAIAVAAMKDYLADFAKELSEFFYCKMLYELMVKSNQAKCLCGHVRLVHSSSIQNVEPLRR